MRDLFTVLRDMKRVVPANNNFQLILDDHICDCLSPRKLVVRFKHLLTLCKKTLVQMQVLLNRGNLM